MASFNWPSEGAGGGGVQKYASVGNLPAVAADGDLAVVLDTDTLYIFNGTTWDPVSAPSAPLTVSDTDSIDLTITGNDLTADLNLSAATADAGFINTTNTIESDGLQVQVPIANTSTTGVLTNTDWNTFNGKQAAGSYITATTGDVVSTGPGSVSATIQPGVIDNAKVGGSAAIEFSKLAALPSANILLGSAGNVATATAVTGDIGISNTGVTAIQSGVIVNADINASAGIDFSKLATLTSGNILVGSAGNVPTAVAMSGDATIVSSGALTIGSNAVTNTKLAQMPTLTLKGNNTGGTTNALDLTVSQVNAMLGTLSNPMTTASDIIYGGASGTPTRLPQGVNGRPLIATASGSAPAYSWGSTNTLSSAGYTILDTDGYTTILVSTGASDQTIVLPAISNNANRAIKIVKTDSGIGKVIVDGNSSETINGELNYLLNYVNTAAVFTAGPTQWSTDVKEKIYLSTSSNIAGSIGTALTDQILEDVEQDPRSIYNTTTGIGITPRDGLYAFAWIIWSDVVSLSTSQRFYTQLFAGSLSQTGHFEKGSGVSVNQSSGGSWNAVYLTKGQLFYLAARSSVATNRDTVNSENRLTLVSVD